MQLDAILVRSVYTTCVSKNNNWQFMACLTPDTRGTAVVLTPAELCLTLQHTDIFMQQATTTDVVFSTHSTCTNELIAHVQMITQHTQHMYG